MYSIIKLYVKSEIIEQIAFHINWLIRQDDISVRFRVALENVIGILNRTEYSNNLSFVIRIPCYTKVDDTKLIRLNKKLNSINNVCFREVRAVNDELVFTVADGEDKFEYLRMAILLNHFPKSVEEYIQNCGRSMDINDFDIIDTMADNIRPNYWQIVYFNLKYVIGIK